MVARVFEAYGAFCLFSLIAFLVWAAVAKLRPDLDEEEFDFIELEKLKQLVNSEQSGDALSIEPAILEEESSWSQPARPVKQGKRRIQRRPHLIHIRKPRMI
jgi:hypothetical protein